MYWSHLQAIKVLVDTSNGDMRKVGLWRTCFTTLYLNSVCDMKKVDMWPRTQSQFQGRIGPGNMEGGRGGQSQWLLLGHNPCGLQPFWNNFLHLWPNISWGQNISVHIPIACKKISPGCYTLLRCKLWQILPIDHWSQQMWQPFGTSVCLRDCEQLYPVFQICSLPTHTEVYSF